MAVLSVLKYPDPRLKLVAKPVEQFDAALAKTCADLFETMYHHDGIGLAAIQVNIQQRILVIDISGDRKQPLCIINPKILNASSEVNSEEGCISFPGVFAKVKRHAIITLEYYNQTGAQQILEARDLLAFCIQHELDHLEGITFFDRLSPLKQKLLRGKISKIRDKTS